MSRWKQHGVAPTVAKAAIGRRHLDPVMCVHPDNAAGILPPVKGPLAVAVKVVMQRHQRKRPGPMIRQEVWPDRPAIEPKLVGRIDRDEDLAHRIFPAADDLQVNSMLLRVTPVAGAERDGTAQDVGAVKAIPCLRLPQGLPPLERKKPAILQHVQLFNLSVGMPVALSRPQTWWPPRSAPHRRWHRDAISSRAARLTPKASSAA